MIQMGGAERQPAATPGLGGRIEKPRRLTDLAYRQLREAMADSRLKPGQSIGEPELSSWLGISRNSTREALIRLETMGFVSRRAGGRWFVYAMNERDAREIYECRSCLEGLAVVRASRNAQEYGFVSSPLEYALEQAQAAYTVGDFELVAQFSGEFHDNLVVASGSQKLTFLLETLQPQMRFNRVAMMRHNRRSGFLRENELLLEAVKSGDGTRARQIVDEIASSDLEAILELISEGYL